ncbi:KilA-N domain-containing protein [Mesorhizobium denitrificans]|uniref:KilA-N domain-containing protein n=1 Tax=Mesorhizobium denitrificans TaxID=2294114 RepID=A0A371XEZ6_9HYPH|nr:KilA-N domain-containing protein [Mesorhizobium denitrificans]RFC67798.1 KilA-N domain-containing protein [Mesorhizobium denitrificans]
MQQHFDLIPHQAQGTVIYQRPDDGYINATAMCLAVNKRFHDYSRLNTTDDFVSALSAETGIPVSDLIVSIKGGDPRLQGTWVHPQVAIHLAQWCSAHFAVKVSQWVYDWMSGKGAPKNAEMPYHLRRYVANQSNVPVGHFSILTELTMALIAPMEAMGYTLPERMVPDISHGRMFCKWLREKHGIDTDALPTYWHTYEDGRRVQAKAYPESLLADWRKHFREEWLPLRATDYFKGRDSEALQFLPRLLPAPKAA